MTDSETKMRALQITVLTEMFLGLGADIPEDRVAYYLRLLGIVPPDILRAACDQAVLASPNGFPPGPGEIMRAAEEIKAKRIKAQRKAWADEQWARVTAQRGDKNDAS